MTARGGIVLRPRNRLRFLHEIYWRKRSIWPGALTAVGVWDLATSQMIPAEWAEDAPRIGSLLPWLPWWAWVMLAVSFAAIIGLEGAFHLVESAETKAGKQGRFDAAERIIEEMRRVSITTGIDRESDLAAMFSAIGPKFAAPLHSSKMQALAGAQGWTGVDIRQIAGHWRQFGLLEVTPDASSSYHRRENWSLTIDRGSDVLRVLNHSGGDASRVA